MFFFLDQPDYECEFINGDGHGRSEYKIGQQTGSECIRACINWMKVGQLGVNGVTVLRDNNPGAKLFWRTQVHTAHISTESSGLIWIFVDKIDIYCLGRILIY